MATNTRVAVVSLFNYHGYGVRLISGRLAFHKIDSRLFCFKRSTYTDTFTWEEVNEFTNLILAYEPTHVLMCVHSPVAPIARTICSIIKIRDNKIRTVVGGPHPTAQPVECMLWADDVCVGDGIRVVDHLADIEYGCDTEDVFYPAASKRLNDVTNLPQLRYSEDDVCFGFNYYDEKMRTNRVSLFTSHGCFYKCSYCHENVVKKRCQKYSVTHKSVDEVMNDIAHMRRTFPLVKEISFSDHIFTFNSDWVRDFCAEFKRTGLKFRCFGHFNFAEFEALDAMQRSGLNCISFGIQHVSATMNKITGRHTPKHVILDVANMLKYLGILGRYDFIRGLPGETLDDIKELNDFIRQLPKPHVIRNFELRYFPGTDITEYALDNGFITEDQVEGLTVRLGDWSYNYTNY